MERLMSMILLGAFCAMVIPAARVSAQSTDPKEYEAGVTLLLTRGRCQIGLSEHARHLFGFFPSRHALRNLHR
jgi:hypothetical protein